MRIEIPANQLLCPLTVSRFISTALVRWNLFFKSFFKFYEEANSYRAYFKIQIQTRPHEPACTVASSQSGPIESDKRFVSLANVSEPSKRHGLKIIPLLQISYYEYIRQTQRKTFFKSWRSVPNQNNSSNVLKTEPQLQPRPQTIQPVQHQQIGQPQIITVQDEKGNSVQTQQLIYQVKIFKNWTRNI